MPQARLNVNTIAHQVKQKHDQPKLQAQLLHWRRIADLHAMYASQLCGAIRPNIPRLQPEKCQ